MNPLKVRKAKCFTEYLNSPFNIKFLHTHNPGQRKQRLLHNTGMTALIETFNHHITCFVLSQRLLSLFVRIEGVHKNKRNLATIRVI